ncbi:MAG TPA: hypothetical protein VE177_06810 [Candidatus Binatus sp.]|nr:hypothetical protein [Candidatus Binatus sp.]
MDQQKPSSRMEPTIVTYPAGLYWSAVLLALVSAAIHIFFGVFVYTGVNMIPMLGIATVYLVGVALVTLNIRRGLWLKIGTGWAAILVVLWAAAAFFGKAPHTTDSLAYLVNAIEVVLFIVLLAIPRYSRIQTTT